MSEQVVALREMAEAMREIGTRAEEGADLDTLRPALLEFRKALGVVLGEGEAESFREKAIVALVSTINDTGGVRLSREGHLCPVGDEEWIDLGYAYELACKALGEEPVIVDAG